MGSGPASGAVGWRVIALWLDRERGVVSQELSTRTVDPGDDRYLEATWRAKERIHRQDEVLAQGRGFFVSQYRRSTVYLVLGPEPDRVAAFALVRRDGYLSLLGVTPEHRRRGLGSQLLDRAAADHDRITCHTRVTNEGAVSFYLDQGFVVEQQVNGYYRDGTDAYKLALGDDEGRLSELADLLE